MGRCKDGGPGGIIKQEEDSKDSFGKKLDLLLYFVLSSSGSPLNITTYGWLSQRPPQARALHQFVWLWTGSIATMWQGENMLPLLAGIFPVPRATALFLTLYLLATTA